MEGFSLKKHIRKEIRELRRSIDPATRRKLDSIINRTLVELAEKAGCTSLSAFFSFDGEPDLRPALEILARRGVQIALPIIVRTTDTAELQFRSWNPGMVLDKNHFGIDEPAAGEHVSLADLDLVLLPLVAWDESGQRLGMGAGYFDRMLAGVKDCMRPLRVGVAYEAQKVSRLPADPWDVRLHRVITENGVFTCAGESGTMPGNTKESGPANGP